MRKAIAKRQVRDLRVRADVQALERAIARFRNDNGRYPQRLEELVSGNYIRFLPHDPAGAAYVVGMSEANFTNAYGFQADQYAALVNNNGDDGMFLYKNGDQASGGTLVDAYGVIDQDGSGEPWEYENSVAVRNEDVTTPTPVWASNEWTITGGDIDIATPGVHVVAGAGFSVTAFTWDTNATAFVVSWESASNYTYGIEWTTNLMDGFSPWLTNIVATPTLNSFTDTFHTTEQGMYRVLRSDAP